MSVAIPKMGQYDLKPSAVKAKRYQRVIPSLGNNPNTGYATGTSPDTIIFYLPCGLANQVMDGQSGTLKFTVKMNATNTNAGARANSTTGILAYLDQTASCFINRIDIYGAGGSLIESVSSYSVLSGIYHDVFYSESDMKGLSPQIGSSFNSGTTSTDTRLGMALYNNSTGTMAQNTATDLYYTFSIPILSSLFQFSEKYLPIWAMNSDIRIEVVLNNLANSIVTGVADTTITSVNILNPEIIVDYIEIDDGAMSAIKSSYAGRDLVIHATSVHNYQTTIVAGAASNFNTILPSKVMSAKYGLFSFRSALLGTADYVNTFRQNPFKTASSQFNLNIGGMRVPQRPLGTAVANDASAYFASTQNAFHAMGALLANGQLPYQVYGDWAGGAILNTPVTAGNGTAVSTRGGFVIGINLDSFTRQSDTMLSGTDLSKITTYVEANFALAVTTNNYILDSFICHDVLLIIDANGSLTVKF